MARKNSLKKRTEDFKSIHPDIIDDLHERMAYRLSDPQLLLLLDDELAYWLGFIDESQLRATWVAADLFMQMLSSGVPFFSRPRKRLRTLL